MDPNIHKQTPKHNNYNNNSNSSSSSSKSNSSSSRTQTTHANAINEPNTPRTQQETNNRQKQLTTANTTHRINIDLPRKQAEAQHGIVLPPLFPPSTMGTHP